MSGSLTSSEGTKGCAFERRRSNSAEYCCNFTYYQQPGDLSIDNKPHIRSFEFLSILLYKKRRSKNCAAGILLDIAEHRAYQNRPAPLLIIMKMGANTRDTTVISLIRMLMDGPEVSLNGSPTVSPTMAATWASEPLPP